MDTGSASEYAAIADPYCLAGKVRAAVTPQERESIVRETAYRLAEQRGFAPGHALDDWLLAEKLVAPFVAP